MSRHVFFGIHVFRQKHEMIFNKVDVDEFKESPNAKLSSILRYNMDIMFKSFLYFAKCKSYSECKNNNNFVEAVTCETCESCHDHDNVRAASHSCRNSRRLIIDFVNRNRFISRVNCRGNRNAQPYRRGRLPRCGCDFIQII